MSDTTPLHPEARSDLDRLLRPAAAAEFLDFKERALEDWRQRGDGPRFVRVSKRAVRYRIRDLISWTEARLCSSTAESDASR